MENLNCLRCRFRHEDNGNCTAIGGFCTAVPAAHCQLLREYLDTGLTPEKIERSKLEIEADKVLASKEAEYIDRKVLKNDIATSTEPFNTGSVFRAINRQAAADVAPVVHGRWIWFDENTGTPITGYEREWGWQCSWCKCELPDDYDDPDYYPKLKYCPNCGAKMDGDVENAKSV